MREGYARRREAQSTRHDRGPAGHHERRRTPSPRCSPAPSPTTRSTGTSPATRPSAPSECAPAGSASCATRRTGCRRPTPPTTWPARRSGIGPATAAPSFIGSLRMMPSLARLAGGYGHLREIARAVSALEARRRASRARASLLPVGARRRPGAPGHGDRHRADGPAPATAPMPRAPRAYLETAIARNVLLYERLGLRRGRGARRSRAPMSTAG